MNEGLNKSGTVKLKMGKTLTLKATLTPADAQAVLTWNSSKPKYATVENGIVRPVKPGTTTVTVTTDNGLTASVKVKVVAVAPTKVTLDRTGTVGKAFGDDVVSPKPSPAPTGAIQGKVARPGKCSRSGRMRSFLPQMERPAPDGAGLCVEMGIVAI